MLGNQLSMSHRKQVSAFILAGGASSRMKRDKALIKLAGEPLIVRTARLLKPLVSSVTVIGPSKPYRRFGLHTSVDKIPGIRRLPAHQGPLTGIVTALGATATPWNLILACDFPYLSQEWIVALLSRALQSKAQAVVPCSKRGLEPLAAVYRRDCLEVLAGVFRDGVRKVTDALEAIHVDTVPLEDLGEFAYNDLVLANMNTPEDFKAAQDWWSSRETHKSASLRRIEGQRSRRRVHPRIR